MASQPAVPGEISAERSALALLCVSEMSRADRLAAEAGVSSLTLMENAGRAVADAAARLVPAGARIAVLCGPGNNGGDGFVAARHLAERGHCVVVATLAERSAWRGDAAAMLARWAGSIDDARQIRLEGAALVIDALFGAGLSRDIDGAYRELLERVAAAGVPVLAVDVPSGVDGDTGCVRGAAAQAARTVTFFRRKPGHLLYPGRALCGVVEVADIGMPEGHLEKLRATSSEPPVDANAPALWRHAFPRLDASGHKYTRGHAVVVSGPPEATGAARLAARGALRVGAGLVTVASPRAAVPVNAAHLTAIMLAPFEVPEGLSRVLSDHRKNAVLIGPGAGVTSETRRMAEIALATGAGVVLDADALTVFAAHPTFAAHPIPDPSPSRGWARGGGDTSSDPSAFFAAIAARKAPTVLTPHEGEFKRLFPDLEGSKLARARAAANRSGAVVILKGPDTVVAAPDGQAAINENAPPWLGTAGSGDVLAGFVAGLLAQGMPAFEAACDAVWLHGECGNVFGRGLIAEDIPEMLPRVFAQCQIASSQ